MAIATGTITRDLRGAFGDFIFRNYNGKTVVSPRPVYKNQSNTPARQQARWHFKDATRFALTAMKNAKSKAYYTQKARQLKLPNAYTAAITDYLRKAKVTAFTRSSFSPRKNALINVVVNKGVFKINNVKLMLCNEHGEVLTQESLALTDAKSNLFQYKLPDDYRDCALLRIATEEVHANTYNIKLSEFRVVMAT